MARKGLPKKYAKMGFKKGWAAYKKTKRRPARVTQTRRKTTRRKTSMARRKKYYRKARYGGGKMKPVIDGAGVQLLENFAGGMVPIPGAIKLGFGWFRNNQTITTIGAMELVNGLLGGQGGQVGGGVR